MACIVENRPRGDVPSCQIWSRWALTTGATARVDRDATKVKPTAVTDFRSSKTV